MKKVISKADMLESLSKGKTYAVIYEDETYITVVDDKGHEVELFKWRFRAKDDDLEPAMS